MTDAPAPDGDKKPPLNFVEEIIAADVAAGKHGGQVQTRFPPEPNGYLHIGHAKSICLNFGLAAKYKGRCNLRFDDTNPAKEEVEFVEAIKEDVRWLGFQWDELRFASDYFETLYEYALKLIDKGLAYVCELSPDAIREHRGSLTEPGTDSPYRERSPEENRALLAKMREGGFEPGQACLRAKIDMASPNLTLRDPVMYRIVKEPPHHRTGKDWCIYPTYDWAHGQSDSIEGITHSLCTLEFENHRPLYDWFCDKLEIHHPQQIESNRLNLTYTVLSKRKLRRLVEEKTVSGWDDPRMPTLIGMRRRGYTPEALRHFCGRIGATKMPGTIEMALLEHSLREDLNKRARRAMAVLDPIRLVIENYPEDQVEEMEAVNNPEDPEAGKRAVPFSRELYIERDDFMEDAPKKFFRLAPEREVRLRYAYIIKCTGVVKDPAGNIVELRATYDPETRSGAATVQRKVKGTIHWVSARHAIPAEVRVYDHLFRAEDPNKTAEGEDFLSNLNPDSLKTLMGCQLEPSLKEARPGSPVQFERKGYFCLDSQDSAPDALVFNRTVGLRDSWAKKKPKGGGQQRRKGQQGQQGQGKKKKKTKAEKNREKKEAKAREKALEAQKKAQSEGSGA